MILTCVKEDCNFSEDGVCVRGIEPPNDCPNLEEQVKATQPKTVAEAVLHGAALTPEEAWDHHLSSGATIVSIVGDVDAGKTTLMGELFRRFQFDFGTDLQWPRFKWTDTLLAFYERLHPSMLASGYSLSPPDRTSAEKDHYLHLQFVYPTGPSTILLQDISGENWRTLRQSGKLWEHAGSVASHADVVLLLLDGGALLKPGQNEVALKVLVDSVRAAVENKIWHRAPRFVLVLTKHDLYESADPVKQSLHDSIATRAAQRLEALVGPHDVIRVQCRRSDMDEMKIQASLQPLFELFRPPNRDSYQAKDPWGDP